MKKTIISVTIAVLLIFSFAVPVLAWQPDSCFSVSIIEENIPENAVYVDFLLPIPPKDAGYVDYNEENGKKFGIAKNSEIVNYNQDGFVSYTFHITDADSEMRPHYKSYFSVPAEVYEENKELLQEFDSECVVQGDTREYEVIVAYRSDTREKLDNISNVLDIKISHNDYGNLHTTYNDSYIRESDYDYEYCCEEYEYAKMVYLDAEGNILGVSSKVKINTPYTGSVQLGLLLEGNDFSKDATTGPPLYLLAVFMICIPVFIVIVGAIVFLLRFFL